MERIDEVGSGFEDFGFVGDDTDEMQRKRDELRTHRTLLRRPILELYGIQKG